MKTGVWLSGLKQCIVGRHGHVLTHLQMGGTVGSNPTTPSELAGVVFNGSMRGFQP